MLCLSIQLSDEIDLADPGTAILKAGSSRDVNRSPKIVNLMGLEYV